MMRTLRISLSVLLCGLAGFWALQSYRGQLSVQPAAIEHLPNFSLPDLDNKHRSIMEWSDKSLIINFWATWCAPCRREMPLLQNIQDQRSDGSLQVVGIAMDNLRDAKRFVEQTDITYPNLYGEYEASIVAESFAEDFIGLPFSVFVAPDGQILKLWPGELSAEELQRIVEEMDAVASGQRSAAQARKKLAAE
jgi:thiol-disulfide isomerase/thioredoxin